jgi:hypothetical protein
MSQVSNTPSPPNDLQQQILNIQPTNTLYNSSVICIICKTVKQKFDGVDLQNHVNDPNFILFLCNALEAAFANKAKSQKINKRDVLMQTLTALSLTVDFDSVTRIVEYLHSSGAIQKIEEEVIDVSTSFFKRCLKYFTSPTQSNNPS